MTIQTKLPTALWPDLPRDHPMIDKDGMMSEVWKLFFDQLILALQTNLKPEGFVIPKQLASNIALLTAIASQNNIVYDSTNQAFYGNIINTTTNAQSWVQFVTIIDSAVDPNNIDGLGNALPGNLNQLCLYTATNVLYICTRGGSSTGTPSPKAVWTAT